MKSGTSTRRSIVASVAMASHLATTLQGSLAWARDASPPGGEVSAHERFSDADPASGTVVDRSTPVSAQTAQSSVPIAAGQEPIPSESAGASSARVADQAQLGSALAGAKRQATVGGSEAISGLVEGGDHTQQLSQMSAPMSAQAISVPSGGGTVAGMGESFTAQLTTGVASFNVPIGLPKARGAAQPTLSLIYGSGGGFGDAGVGWSLSGQLYIARQTDRGTPAYDDRADFHPNQDRFVFGGQELVPICKVSSGSCAGALAGEVMPAWSSGYQYFRARIEGAYLRFFWAPNHRTWRVQGKGGEHFELGEPLDGSGYSGGIEANPARPSEIYRWHLVRQYDSHGTPDAQPLPLPTNPIVYRYRQDGGGSTLSDIYYDSPAASPSSTNLALYAYHVAIDWEQRPDELSSYRAGFAQWQQLRLSRVSVSSKPFAGTTSAARELVRRFHLTYDAQAHASLLESVQVEGRCLSAISEDSAGGLPDSDCERLPPLTFGYQRVDAKVEGPRDAAGRYFEPFNEQIVELGDASPPHSLDEQNVALTDINGDALPDLLVTAPGLYSGKHGLFLNGAAGRIGFGKNVGMAVSGVGSVDAGVLSFGNRNVSPLDPDGDGTINLLHMPAVKTYSVFTPVQVGGAWTWQGRAIDTASGLDAKVNFATDAPRVARMDVNADGLIDLVFSSATELQTFFALGRLPGGDTQFGHGSWASASTADLSNEPVTACVPWSAAAVRFDDPEVRVAEMNGDGLPDIVRVRDGQVLYWPGRGNGFWGTGDRDDCRTGFAQDRHLELENPPRFGSTAPGSLQLGDINGDGLADLVEYRFDAVDIYLNDNGRGFSDRVVLGDVPVKPYASNYVQLTDLNGSGSSDLVWGRAHEYRYIDLTGGVQPYLLTSIDNGLGKLTLLDYASSTSLMLAAQAAHAPWAARMPMVTSVVVRSTVRDRLEAVGRPAGKYVSEYVYRDPVFEGRQREFVGFRSVDTRTLGDANSPTVTNRSTFLLGQCEVAQNGFDACAANSRFLDNWRAPLKGLVSQVETFDEAGVYQSTVSTRYELRQLYTGRDGRRVSAALPVGSEAFLYDTASFTPAATSVSLPSLDVALSGITQSESTSVTKRATSGTVRLRSSQTYDNFGNALVATKSGCVEGCAAADPTVTEVREYGRPAGDDSGWLLRNTRSYTTGSSDPAPRHEKRYQYDAAGDVAVSFVKLSGTLLLDRFHETGAAVAPAPTNASQGVSAPVELTTMTYTRDVFGNSTRAQAPLNRCRSVTYDALYASFPIAESSHGGALNNFTGCGNSLFTTQATYDRGLGVVVTHSSITGQPALFEFDFSGRLLSKTEADPASPGQLAGVPTEIYEYELPVDPVMNPYTIVRLQRRDGASVNTASFHDEIAYTDGLGRPLIALSEADTWAGDGGQYVAGSYRTYDAKGGVLRAYQSFFWSGDPDLFPLDLVPSTAFGMQQNDAFGRKSVAYGLDGQPKAAFKYHALSQDVWDAEDLLVGPHGGSFATSASDGHGRPVQSIERIKVGATLEQRAVLSEYLPSGELRKITQRRSGSPDVVRWFRYDSLGRLVQNAEPNSSVSFVADPQVPPNNIKAWRYAYNDAGDLVGTSDARGCGVNYTYDLAGRRTTEDYSPCRADQVAYIAPDFVNKVGIEILYTYDAADASLGTISDAAGKTFAVSANLYWGRPVSISDRGARTVVRYDALGRVTGNAKQIVKPGVAHHIISQRYAPRWYITERLFDGGGRNVETSTGSTLPELMGSGGKSVVTATYSGRGLPVRAGSSYGNLVAGTVLDANGRVLSKTYGDGAGTQTTNSYDQLGRLSSTQTFRATPPLWSSAGYPAHGVSDKSQQLLLQDADYTYDAVSNITELTDYRVTSEWPDRAKPVTRRFEYDDAYRLTRATYQYPGGFDLWQSPYVAENSTPSITPKPAPHVAFDRRPLEQTYAYDHLGNISQSSDDAQGFYDRSLGAQSHGTPVAGPHRLAIASNRSTAPASTRKGDLDTRYDAAGNLTDLTIRRDGACLQPSCWQRYSYSWDEVGQLVSARRWDLAGAERTANDSSSEPVPPRAVDASLQYSYDSTGQRVLKSAPVGTVTHTVYINDLYELRQTTFTSDYALTAATAQLSITGLGVRGRVQLVPGAISYPAASGTRHLFLELGDHLGSSSLVIDQATGELVEASSYQPYGVSESDYRPQRWGQYRSPNKFTGKEEDIQVGLVYFGARYLVANLGRWASPDPVTIHDVTHAAQGGLPDLNPYAYTRGRPTVATDPDGRFAFFAVVAIVAVVNGIVQGSRYLYNQAANDRTVTWKGFWGAVADGALDGAITTSSFGQMSYAPPMASSTISFGIGLLVASGDILRGRNVWESVKHGLEVGALVHLGGLMSGNIGAANGLSTGGREIYDFSNWTGYAAFATDSSWGKIGTSAGNYLNGMNTFYGEYSRDYSRRQNRQVFLEGMAIRDGSAFTQGNVVSNLHTTYGNTYAGSESERELLGHETDHIMQNRVFGMGMQSTYVVSGYYGFWIGVVWWAGAQIFSEDRPNLFDTLETTMYYDQPFEQWGYRANNPTHYQPPERRIAF